MIVRCSRLKKTIFVPINEELVAKNRLKLTVVFTETERTELFVLSFQTKN